MDLEALRRAEATLSESLVDPGAWSRALELISVGAGARGLAVLPLQGRVPGAAASSGVEHLFDSYYREGWATRDARYAGVGKLLRTGIVADQDYLTPDDMDRNPFWADFLAKHDVRWFCGLTVRAGDDLWCLALQRSAAQGAFLSEEQDGLMSISDSLSRSATLLHQLGHAKLDGFGEALDYTGIANFVLDRHGRVVRSNALAQALLADDLTLRDGELVVTGRPDLSHALRLHVAATLWSGVDPADRHLRSVVLPRNGRPALRVTAHLIRGVLNDPFAPGRVLLVVDDIVRPSLPGPRPLRSLFALTDSEIRLVQALAGGKDLQAAAIALGVTHQTARSYLKSIFSKTETRHQVELVALVSRLRD